MIAFRFGDDGRMYVHGQEVVFAECSCWRDGMGRPVIGSNRCPEHNPDMSAEGHDAWTLEVYLDNWKAEVVERARVSRALHEAPLLGFMEWCELVGPVDVDLTEGR